MAIHSKGRGPAHVTRVRGAGAAPASPAPGSAATALPTAPSVHYHPGVSGVTLTAGRVAAATDLRGLADASEGLSNSSLGGPLEMTDALGRKFWRFRMSEYLNVAAGLESVNSQAVAIFMVGRHHHGNRAQNPILGLGNVSLGTALNTNGVMFNGAAGANAAPFMKAANQFASAATSNAARMVLGAQLQVCGFASRTAGAGGLRFYLNNDVAPHASLPTNATSAAGSGAEIGRYPQSPTGVGSAWGGFDLYEIAIYKGTLTNAQADAIAAALVANWGIAAITDQLVVEGDSITQGWTAVPGGRNLAMRLTDPGVAGVVPASCRVVNMGTSGNTTAQVTTRRDATNTIYGATLSGRNIVAVQTGANDYNAMTGAQIYAAICDLIDTASVGYAQRGWETACAVNVGIANGTSWLVLQDLRTLLRNVAQFRADCGGLSAQQLRLIDLALVTVAGGSVFNDQSDAGDALYYMADGLHPNDQGTGLMALGGDTLANGYAQRALGTS